MFYLAEPTEKNLAVYEKHFYDKNGAEKFMGTALKKKGDGLFKLTIEEGETVFLPAGWIHAVYTPVDSIVFGGNFFHDLGIEFQHKYVFLILIVVYAGWVNFLYVRKLLQKACGFGLNL